MSQAPHAAGAPHVLTAAVATASTRSLPACSDCQLSTSSSGHSVSRRTR